MDRGKHRGLVYYNCNVPLNFCLIFEIKSNSRAVFTESKNDNSFAIIFKPLSKYILFSKTEYMISNFSEKNFYQN